MNNDYISEDELRTKLKARLYDERVSLGAFCEMYSINSGSAYAWINGSYLVKNAPQDLLNILGYKRATVYVRK